MNAAGARVFADSRAHPFGESRVPGTPQAKASGVARGGKAGVGADSNRTVRYFKCRQLEPGHGADGEAGAADVVNLLLQSHLLDQGGSSVMDVVGGLCEELRCSE